MRLKSQLQAIGSTAAKRKKLRPSPIDENPTRWDISAVFWPARITLAVTYSDLFCGVAALVLEVVDITRRFGDFTALERVSLQITGGEFFTLLGPSGCGKTTLLRIIAGFDQPDSGEILLDGKPLLPIAPEQRPVHTVFQNYALFPHMTVADNIAFPLRMAGVDRREIRRRVAEALASVRLADKGRRYPDALSGGQRQRIAIARALVNRPRLLLLDEPLSALDAKLREQMQLELINLQKEVGITFVYVTHDQGEALALSHRIAVMNAGRVAQIAEPTELYSYPQDRFVADFIGQCNLLEGQVLALDEGSARVQLDGLGEIDAELGHGHAFTEGSPCALALRPEKVRLGGALQAAPGEVCLSGEVHDTLYLGDVTVYLVELANGLRLQALLANNAPGRSRLYEVGEAVQVAWHRSAGHLLS